MSKEHFNNLIVDGNGMAYRVFSSNPSFKKLPSSMTVGLFIHLFLNQFISLSKKYTFDNIVLCWDSRINKRKSWCRIYKNKKKEKKPEDKFFLSQYYACLNLLKEDLGQLGSWGFVEEEGYEGDDIVAKMVNDSVFSGKTALVVTSDNDLYQLLSPLVSIHLLHMKSLYTKEHFEGHYGINPKDWPEIKAMMGDTSDNVIGINGIGEKTALKYFLDSQTLTLSKRESIEKNRKLIEHNLELVKLPFDDLINVELPTSNFDIDKFTALWQKHSLKNLDMMKFREMMNG